MILWVSESPVASPESGCHAGFQTDPGFASRDFDRSIVRQGSIMDAFAYSNSPWPVRADLSDAFRHTWQKLAHAGNWLTGVAAKSERA